MTDANQQRPWLRIERRGGALFLRCIVALVANPLPLRSSLSWDTTAIVLPRAGGDAAVPRPGKTCLAPQ